MKLNIKLFLLAVFLITGCGISLAAEEVNFEISLDRARIGLGESMQLGLTFYGTQSMPAPDIGNISGLEIRYLGPSTMMTVINGKVSSSITHMYKVLPLRVGRFQLGPFSFNYKGGRYLSNTAFLDVVEEQVAEKPRAAPITEKLDLEDRIFLTLGASKTRAYVNELIPVTIKLYVNRLNVRDIQLPSFAQEGFSKAEFREPKQYREELGGLIYDVLEFKTTVFATRAGDYKLGPAAIKCNVIAQKRRPGSPGDEFFNNNFRDEFFDDFFSRFETHPLELKSQDAPLVISPLPIEGRPQDYSGAIGDFQFIFSANPKNVKVGDPVTLVMEINGSGNFNTVLQPRLDNVEGFRIYEVQVKTGQNRKEFTQVAIPEKDTITETPKAIFNYFDPNKREYRAISQGPIKLEVEKGKEEPPAQVISPVLAVPAAIGDEKLAKDIIYIKESAGRLRKKDSEIYKNRIFLTLLALPFLFLAVFWAFNRRMEHFKRDSRYAGRVAAYRLARTAFRATKHKMKGGNEKVFYETVFKTLQEYLGNRFAIPPAGITYDAVEAALKSRDADPGILAKLKRLFEVCDQAKFGLLNIDELSMKDDLKELKEIIGYFERARL